MQSGKIRCLGGVGEGSIGVYFFFRDVFEQTCEYQRGLLALPDQGQNGCDLQNAGAW